MAKVTLVTFKTNHTIIGDLVKLTDTQVTIKKPVQVIVIPPRTDADQGGIAFSPFLEYTEEFGTGLTFELNDVLIVTTPVRELENRYNQVFGVGIQIASTIPGA